MNPERIWIRPGDARYFVPSPLSGDGVEYIRADVAVRAAGGPLAGDEREALGVCRGCGKETTFPGARFLGGRCMDCRDAAEGDSLADKVSDALIHAATLVPDVYLAAWIRHLASDVAAALSRTPAHKKESSHE